MKINRKDARIEIREQQAFLDRVKIASEKMGLTPTDFIRMLLKKGLKYYEVNVIPKLIQSNNPKLELKTSNIDLVSNEELKELEEQMKMFK